MYFANPSPEGRGCREAAGEGCKEASFHPSPGSLREPPSPFRRGIRAKNNFQYGCGILHALNREDTL
jgi:hypothetical protein